MKETLDTLSGLGPGERVRLAFADGDPIELRVNQKEYDLREYLRLELTSDGSGRDERYQLESRVDEGSWTHPAITRYDPDEGAWTTLDEVTDATALGVFGTVRSADMVAQEGPALAARHTIGDNDDA